MARSRIEPHDGHPESNEAILLVHSPFTGNIGIGRIVHIEPAGQFAITRATAFAQEQIDELGAGNIRLVSWIGEKYDDVPEPCVGNFVLFDEVFAAPFWHANKLVNQFTEEIKREQNRLEQTSRDIDI